MHFWQLANFDPWRSLYGFEIMMNISIISNDTWLPILHFFLLKPEFLYNSRLLLSEITQSRKKKCAQFSRRDSRIACGK